MNRFPVFISTSDGHNDQYYATPTIELWHAPPQIFEILNFEILNFENNTLVLFLIKIE